MLNFGEYSDLDGADTQWIASDAPFGLRTPVNLRERLTLDYTIDNSAGIVQLAPDSAGVTQ